MSDFSPEINLLRGRIEAVASITVEVLPYRALFLADPFIFTKGGTYHLFCEVFVSGTHKKDPQKEKRIAHLRSEDGSEWAWVADALTGDDFSFPAIYETGCEDEVILVPQISGTRDIRAYNYNLVRCESRLAWRGRLNHETKDLVFVRNPASHKSYLIYGSNFKGRASLMVSETTMGPAGSDKVIGVGEPRVISKKMMLRSAFSKLAPIRRPTWRPAGGPFGVDALGFVLPIQASRTGIYGEMLALVSFSWDFSIRKVAYIPAGLLEKGAERLHHISMSTSGPRFLACFDVVPGGGNRWELRVAKEVPTHYDGATI